MDASSKEIAARCKAVLRRHYGSRLRGPVLYGSTTRGDASADSDIGLLVLLASPVDYFDELRRIADLLYQVQLESDRLISAKPAAADDFEQEAIPLYRNARREGVAL